MIANMPWNIAWACSGIVDEYVGLGSNPTLLKPTHDRPPSHEFPGENAMEYPTSIHWTPITPSATTLIIIVFSAFLGRTKPP